MSNETDKVNKHIKAFQDLWVSGMAGTFFFFLWRSLAQDTLGRAPQFDAIYGLDRVLRYGYLLWLFGYFFVAAIENDPVTKPKPGDIIFDVLQSICSVVAALFLGFVLPLSSLVLPLPEQQGAYLLANAAVIATCGLSLLIFSRDKDHWSVNWLRSAGLAVGIGSLLLVALGPLGYSSLLILGGLQFVLWIVLVTYWSVRLR